MIQHTLFFPILLDGIINAAVTQIQGILQNLVSVGSAGTVGFSGHNVTKASSRFIADPPFGSVRGVANGDGIVVADTIGRLKSFHHELLHNRGGKPCGTQPHINFRCFQIFGLRLGQCGHIDLELRAAFCGKLCHPQFIAHITRKVFVRCLPAGFRVGGVGDRVLEDHTRQFSGDAPVLVGCAQQFCHIGQIHLAVFPDGHRQRFTWRIHAGDGAFRANGALGEHRRLGFKLPLLVQIFQRTQQIIGGILLKQPPVFTVVQQTVLCGKVIVGGVQTLLCCLDVGIWVILQLLLNQVIDDLPQFHHAGDAPLGVIGQFHLRHDGVFAVVDLAIHHSIAEIFHGRICGQRFALCFHICDVRGSNLHRSVIALNMLHRFCKLVCQHCTLNGCNGEFLPSVLGAFCGQFAQNHLRVAYEILVDGKAVLGLAKLHPVRLMVNGAVTLLQKDNVADNIRASIGAKRIIRQTDSTQQVSTLCHVLASGAVLAVHGVAASNKGNNAARTHLVDGFGEKVVVDRKSQLVVRLVVDFILTKRDITYGKVVKISAVGGFKASNRNVGLWI